MDFVGLFLYIMIEEFRDIPNYEGFYQVSNFGNVKSLTRLNNLGRMIKEKILKSNFNGGGYYQVVLYKYGKPNTRTVHQLVAEVFLNHVPNGYKSVVNHIDLIKTNNNLNNLEIISSRENSNHKHIKSSSIYTGVSFDKNSNKWKSQIHINGVKKHLGLFDCELKAHYKYQEILKTL